MILPDITIRWTNPVIECGMFALVPHSEAADNFLFSELSFIERDLTLQDVDLISRRAERRGFVVRDLLRKPAA